MSDWPRPPDDGGSSQPPPWAAPPPPTGSAPGWQTPAQGQWGSPGYGGQQYTYGAPPTWEQPRTSGTAIASLVLGLLWLCGAGSLLALILGIVARADIRKSGGKRTGSGLATAGIVLGVLGVLGTVGVWLAFINAPPEFHEGFNQGLIEESLQEGARLQEDYLEQHGTYASDEGELFGGTADFGLDFAIVHASTTAYCMQATRGTTTMHREQDDPVARSGPCPS